MCPSRREHFVVARRPTERGRRQELRGNDDCSTPCFPMKEGFLSPARASNSAMPILRKLRFALLLIVIVAGACVRMETALPAYPPAKLKQVSLTTAPPPAPEPWPDPHPLLDQLRCGMSRAEVDQVLKRMGLPPLRPIGGGAWVSRSGTLEARVTFKGGLSAGEVATGSDSRSGFDCGQSPLTPVP